MAEPESLHGIEFVVHEDLLDKESLSVVSKTQREKMWLMARLPLYFIKKRGKWGAKNQPTH
ncbi:hypothetical protein, partial [Halomonas llamarensis]